MVDGGALNAECAALRRNMRGGVAYGAETEMTAVNTVNVTLPLPHREDEVDPGWRAANAIALTLLILVLFVSPILIVSYMFPNNYYDGSWRYVYPRGYVRCEHKPAQAVQPVQPAKPSPPTPTPDEGLVAGVAAVGVPSVTALVLPALDRGPTDISC